MQTKILALLTILTIGQAFAADRLDLKPGQWETTTTVKSGANVQSFTNKGCVTQEEPDKAFITRGANCTRSVISSSSRKEELRMQCTVGGMTTNGTIEVEALDSEHVKGSSHVVSSGTQSMTVNTEFTGHFVSPSCGGHQ